MNRSGRAIAVAGAIFAVAAVNSVRAQLDAQTASPEEFFAQRVRPVLAENCLSCHDATAMGGLRLDSGEGVIKGGKTGPAIVVGDPDKSLLLAAVRRTGALKMPMNAARLSEAKIADLSEWIKNGAVWMDASIGVKPESVLAEHFETRIRPLLAQQCFACHTNTKAGGLRLDSRQGLLTGGNSGPAVVPGDPEKSILIAAIRHIGAVKMPKNATRLPDEQIDNFVTWVKDGAYWPPDKFVVKQYTDTEKKIWSIQPLEHPSAPSVKDTAWPINDIDRFVLARLEQQGLKPAPTADRRTLLRRVTYDLVGLMPTYEEVRAFENDKSPNAWEKVVDRLLASPHYGEKWGRHWMDVVRYGEDDYNVAQRPERAEKYPYAYIYRDWLIRALNDDMSYDMFIRTQLADDLLEPRVRDQNIAALGMHGNGSWIFNSSPPSIERADEWHDKVDVTSKAFLGLTVGCARCHDHKYDAIYTRDYYQLASVFASSRYKAYPTVPKAVVDAYETEAKILKKKNADLEKFLENASDLYAKMLFGQTESYMMAAWKVGSQKRATVASIAEESKLDPELLERWVRFLKKKPDNYTTLVPWQEMVARNGKEEEAKKLAHDFYLKVAELDELHTKLERENTFTIAQVRGTTEPEECATCLDEEKERDPFDPLPNDKKRPLIRYQIDLKALEREDQLLWRDVFDRDVPGATEEVEEGARKPGLLKLTDGALERRLTADLKAHVDRARADIEEFKKSMPPHYPFVYGIAEAKEPSDLKVFVRGNPYSFGPDAPRAFPSIFTGGTPTLFTKGSGRLDLAEAIIKQPITARVIANRVWRWHMGRGIVETPSNFGIAGDRPTNPELLDYLACRFLDDGMSWKRFSKEILMSRTYQMSVTPIAANAAKDPDNKFFWRANRQRLEAEGVWDELLQASGKLDLTLVGGPSSPLNDKMTRRAVYATVSRLYPADFQLTFDLPPATISAEKRFVTNVPQQRLFFLNNSVVQEQAATIADRLKSDSLDAQVKKAFELIYQRAPSTEEISASIAYLKKPPIRQAEETPAKTDDTPAKKGNEGAAARKALPDSPLRSFVWALLSSNEFLYID